LRSRSSRCQVETNRRYFAVVEKPEAGGPSVVAAAAPLTGRAAGDGLLARMVARTILRQIGATLSRVPVVIFAPSRKRDTSLPSLTTRRPNVDSAVRVARQ